MYYISKERNIFTLFTGTSKSENNMKLKRMYAKKVIFYLYFQSSITQLIMYLAI